MYSTPWSPIPRPVLRDLLKGAERPLSEPLAFISIQLDHDEGNPVSIKGLGNCWQWSRGKVRRFLASVGASIDYSGWGKFRHDQRGLIALEKRTPEGHLTSTPRHKKGQPKLICFNKLENESDTQQGENGHRIDTRRDTTKKNKHKITLLAGFDAFWNAYPRKAGKQAAIKSWQRLNPTAELQMEIIAAIDRHKATEQWQINGGQFVPHPSSWLNGRRWEDELIDSLTATQAEPNPTSKEIHHRLKSQEIAASYGLE